MQLTKLRAAPVWRAEVPPCAPAGHTDGGTASQLIRGVGRTSWEGDDGGHGRAQHEPGEPVLHRRVGLLLSVPRAHVVQGRLWR